MLRFELAEKLAGGPNASGGHGKGKVGGPFEYLKILFARVCAHFQSISYRFPETLPSYEDFR
jgi:hypothetical protein